MLFGNRRTIRAIILRVPCMYWWFKGPGNMDFQCQAGGTSLHSTAHKTRYHKCSNKTRLPEDAFYQDHRYLCDLLWTKRPRMKAMRSFVQKCGETLFVLDQQAVSDVAQDPSALLHLISVPYLRDSSQQLAGRARVVQLQLQGWQGSPSCGAGLRLVTMLWRW